MKDKKIIAIIPARGGSKGIPKKNIINFCGKPLIAWSIEQALKARLVSSVFVSTNNEEIAKVSRKYGAKIVKRPKELSTDTSSSEEALLHALNQIEKEESVDIVVFLQATSPIRTSEDIDNAIKLFMSRKAGSLFSAAILESFCIWEWQNEKLMSFTYDYHNRARRQDRKPLYLENGSIYVFKPETLRRYNNRLGGKIIMYMMDYWKSYQIDKLKDVEMCEHFMRKILNK